jgi:hypothetical protein
MTYNTILQDVFLWILIILFSWIISVQVIVRLIRRFIHFPIPLFIARPFAD